MPWDFWLIFFVLAALLPWRGRARMKKLLAMPHVSSIERLVLYASTIAFQWLAVAIVGWRVWAHGYTAAQLGLVLQDRTKLIVAGLVGAAIGGALQGLNLRRVGRIPVESRGPLQAVADRILPQAAVELPPYFALAITAGLCEEFLYRGFAIAALAQTGLRAWLVVLISSLLFGLAHSYQGRGGMVMTFLVGLVLGVSRLTYNSLIPAIFWHSAIDAVAGVAGARYLKRNNVGREQHALREHSHQ
jgi:membrane protease YdiL (CAAX protease family)